MRLGGVAKWGRLGAQPFHLLAPADDLYPKIYHSCFFVVTYLAPLGLMAMAYFQIFRKLWGRQVRPTLVSLSGLGGHKGPHLREYTVLCLQNMPFWLQPERQGLGTNSRPEVRGSALEPSSD